MFTRFESCLPLTCTHIKIYHVESRSAVTPVSDVFYSRPALLPMKFWKRQGSGCCSAADRLPRLSVAKMIRMSHGLGMPGTAAETYCLEGPKPVADSIVIGDRFGATDTFCLRPPKTATDTQSISHNIKYTQTPAETENIGSPETASGIGHTSYQFRPTYSLRIRYNFCSSYSGPYTNNIRSVFRGTYTSLFLE
jgi:hypothetical protein